ncbi:CHAT domain-containing protein [Tolypothrix sp. FACHB-123]|uniref:CHAT domain-containing protein n=1 Tax=Tolypothrix sp. FACHB-123 TaxID=2692868 RepID=UPI001682CF9A|nr:CHAT domain-containing protein [Tolypothrix sp. FACHB-123]MBD2358582.1 CHAT domain-containing protein [Tolypothrix sp. FACHB-123]
MAVESSQKIILILAANPKGTSKLRLEEEVRDIEEGLRQSSGRDQFLLKAELALRPRDMYRALLRDKPKVVHFCGHGNDDGGLVLENVQGEVHLVEPKALAALFELFADCIECIVLNACYSAVQAEAIAQHIPYVIGMNQAIGDRAAIEFAVGFYDALGAGESIKFAYELGCRAIGIYGISGDSTPKLIQKTDFLQPKSSLETGNINESDSARSSNATVQEKYVKYEFVLSGTLSEASKERLEAILAHLREMSKDTRLTLIRVEAGSIRLILEGSEEGFNRLQKLVYSGFLSELEGFPIEYFNLLTDVSIEDPLLIGVAIYTQISLITHEETPDLIDSVDVSVEQVATESDIVRVSASIFVEHPHQKQIFTRDSGRLLKMIGHAARKQLAILLNSKVYLELYVTVKVRRNQLDQGTEAAINIQQEE